MKLLLNFLMFLGFLSTSYQGLAQSIESSSESQDIFSERNTESDNSSHSGQCH